MVVVIDGDINQYLHQYHQEVGWAEKADYAECLVLITSLQLKGSQEVRKTQSF